MRKGFTTGSCATAAAKAAAFMLFTRVKKENISIMTPAGITYSPEVTAIELERDYVSCGIVKDAGDDPDVTNNILVCARVEFCSEPGVEIRGGKGVGLVTRPGLEMPVGQWAINSTPRKMITEELMEVADLFDYKGGFVVTVFVPEGEAVAQKTFNPHMGIEGGISILGTTGIVEPMSLEALIKTIKLDLSVKRAEGNTTAIMVPGNYGETFLGKEYKVAPERIVHFSNYMGAAIDLAKEEGFSNVLVVGHTGKLVKVSGGIMNTHSKDADSRLELMAAAAIKAAKQKGIDLEMDFLDEILEQMTTSAVLELLKERGLLYETSQVLLDKILYHLRRRAGDGLRVECILYENSFGLLAKSEHAEELL